MIDSPMAERKRDYWGTIFNVVMGDDNSGEWFVFMVAGHWSADHLEQKTSKLNHRCASHTCAYLCLLTYLCNLYNISHRLKLWDILSICRFRWPIKSWQHPVSQQVQVSVHCSGSSWPVQRSSSTPRSAWLKIDQQLVREKPDKTNGVQDLPRPQLLTGRDRLCEGLWSSKEARFCHEMQGQGWTLQVLYQECRSFLKKWQNV